MTGEDSTIDSSDLMEMERSRGSRNDGFHDEQVRFLGGGNVVEIPVVAKRYYSDLLSWVTGSYIREKGWQVLRLAGQKDNPEPRYRKASLGPGKFEDVMINGAMFLQRGETRLVCQVWMYRRTMIVICCNPADREEGEKFATDVRRLLVERNPYRGGKITYAGRIRFLELKPKDWDDVIMDERLKDEVRFNTTGFHSHAGELTE